MTGPDREMEILARAKAGDAVAREEILLAYRPLVQRVASAFCRRPLEWGRDDELSIGLIALNEAIDSYRVERGASFRTYAHLIIRSRLTDYLRRESRQQKAAAAAAAQNQKALPGEEEWLAWERGEEIKRYAGELARFGITFQELAAICPKHRETRHRLIQAARHLAAAPLLDELRRTGRVPLQELARASRVHRKTLERGRKYLIALALVLGAPEKYSHLAAYLARLDGGEGRG
ncbi:MAG: RNA polymerase sigma factor SigI [Clostridia bacterium]|nr:RNA polymerase sigma factor SigI [Clostridia bacterium]